MSTPETTAWPALQLESWWETRNTLHRWTQIVGKIRLALTPRVNHWWNVPLYISARGLTTSAIPYGERWFDIEFDFLSHVLRVRTSDGAARELPLTARSVAQFYRDVFETLASLDIECHISPKTSEIFDEPLPLDSDDRHRSYDREYAQRFWRILALSDAVFTKFRAEFIGKCSPVHFFWGSFDLAVTRFSGRPAPARADADAITREAYSHEVSSVGFWPGDSRLPKSAFYSYVAPEPEGYRTAAGLPPSAAYNTTLNGFYLDYEDLRSSRDPEQTLLDFCRTTYTVGADLGRWDRASLERDFRT